MSLVVFGKNGNVSSSLGAELSRRGDQFIHLGKDQVDFRDGGDAALKALDLYRPSFVINAAAFTQVDLAETMRDEAFMLNAFVPGRIARWCADHGVPLIHFSTDYVFDGQKDSPWVEEDPVRPLNVYGESKLAGEQAIASSGARHIILRTSWLFRPQGANFYATMHKLGREKSVIRIVHDQVGSPTYTRDIAQATLSIVDSLRAGRGESGIYHICNQGYISWCDFAKEIFSLERSYGCDLMVKEVHPIKTAEYGAPAIRPPNSCLNTTKIKEAFGIELKSWRDSLVECVREKMEVSSEF